MTIYSRNCFTYLIGWSAHNIWYYGRRTAFGCSPDDIWNTYFTSSEYVSIFRGQYGEPDIIQVRKVFGEDYQSCEQWETKVLTRINAAAREDFLNKHNNSATTTNRAPAFNSDQQFIGLVECDHPGWGSQFYGINKFKDLSKWGEAGRAKAKEKAALGIHPLQIKSQNGTHHLVSGHPSRARLDQHQRDLVASGLHYWKSEEHKTITGKRNSMLIREGKHPFGKQVTCPHCGKTGQKAAMYRFHFNKCRSKP
jgi:hypothetical protein